MQATDIARVPNGFLWAGAVSPDRTQDINVQTLGTPSVLDTYLKVAWLDRTQIAKAEVVVTSHDNKPAFDEARAS